MKFNRHILCNYYIRKKVEVSRLPIVSLIISMKRTHIFLYVITYKKYENSDRCQTVILVDYVCGNQTEMLIKLFGIKIILPVSLFIY